ncbi:hypothetical protein B0F90DRAFT_1817851 [Multifurca ochricompacta]|uniref:Uncharacterized protein n=1 Tax=Multifurca ochricompacta TaxID=376703 RepID=A0AAD4QKH5_9AGAM|nr:hypothetical protein B0F90DRAFT_1817851 [Multifurca ochricompacta]
MTIHRVAIVGAGAAGLSAAYALSKHTDKFIVTVFEKEPVAGGMASSTDIDPVIMALRTSTTAFRAAPQLSPTRCVSFASSAFHLREISFGKGENFWTNVFPSPLTERHAADIRKFGRVLKTVKLLEVVLALLPVYALLHLFGLSKDFGERMVYPLTALFFGTGNQTPYVASAILVTSLPPPHQPCFSNAVWGRNGLQGPSMRLFKYDERSLLASIPEMYAFQKLSDTYTAWQHKVEQPGNVTFLLGHVVTRLISRTKKRTVLEFRSPSNELRTAEFESLILATDADNALTILGKRASWMERRVLGGVKYLYDLTVTHTDADYMRKHYETEFKPELIASSATGAERQRGQTDFRPLYYTYQYPSALNKLEMSFDLTFYQPQLSATLGQHHVYQTIFLDRDGSDKLWTKDGIRQDFVIGEKWWKQQSHRWQHYARVVPWMWTINGTRGTYYAGAWTVLNMHEIAIMSGFAAAYSLGADYPHLGDEESGVVVKVSYIFVLFAVTTIDTPRIRDQSPFILQNGLRKTKS